MNLVDSIIQENYIKANEALKSRFVEILKNKLQEAKKIIAAKVAINEEKPKIHPDFWSHDRETESKIKKFGKEQRMFDKAKAEINREKKKELKKEETENLLDEKVNRNVQKMGRLKLIRVRVRGGKVQRRKKLSSVKGFTFRGGKLKRMSPMERRRRRLGARRAKIKRRSKRNQIRIKTRRALRKRKSMGLK